MWAFYRFSVHNLVVTFLCYHCAGPNSPNPFSNLLPPNKAVVLASRSVSLLKLSVKSDFVDSKATLRREKVHLLCCMDFVGC